MIKRVKQKVRKPKARDNKKGPQLVYPRSEASEVVFSPEIVPHVSQLVRGMCMDPEAASTFIIDDANPNSKCVSRLVELVHMSRENTIGRPLEMVVSPDDFLKVKSLAQTALDGYEQRDTVFARLLGKCSPTGVAASIVLTESASIDEATLKVSPQEPSN